MADPVSLATLALGGANALGGLLGKGGGGGGGGSITKQDNYQNTNVNVSVGDFGAALRASSPFPGAVSSSFVTPVGYGGGAVGGGILDTIQQNWLLLAAGVGAVFLFKRMKAA